MKRRKKWKTKSNKGADREASASKPSSKSVVIDIPEIEEDHKPDDATSVQSLFISLPEAIEVVPKSASVLW